MARRPTVVLGDGFGPPEKRMTDPTTRSQFALTNARYVRLWANWRFVHDYTPGWPIASSAPAPSGSYLQLLDDNISAARAAAGRQVILTAYTKPSAVPGQAGTAPSAPNDEFRFPADTAVMGEWGRWIRFLIERYGKTLENPTRYVEFLEVTNEPNQQMWPQLDSSGSLSSPCKTAEMMWTSKQIRDGYPGTDLILVGPAATDYGGTSSKDATNVGYFVGDTLQQLNSYGFNAGNYFAWSQHAYRDAELERTRIPTSYNDSNASNNRTQLTRLKLGNAGWTGWPGGNGILLTEAGVRYSQAGYNRSAQGTKLSAWLNAINGPCGNGVQMVTNYLLFTDPSYDTGLCPPYPNPGQALYPNGAAFRSWAAANQ